MVWPSPSVLISNLMVFPTQTAKEVLEGLWLWVNVQGVESKGGNSWIELILDGLMLDLLHSACGCKNLFDDGVYHRSILEVRVDRSRKLHQRHKGANVQWTLPSEAVAIMGLWIGHKTGNPS